jgi:hypothetical protein
MDVGDFADILEIHGGSMSLQNDGNIAHIHME